jgi:hypothetical protein
MPVRIGTKPARTVAVCITRTGVLLLERGVARAYPKAIGRRLSRSQYS